MERIFFELLNRAICAGWLVPVILFLRVILKKMPKWIRCLLWGMVAIRLLVPIQIESAVSLIPSAQTVSPDIMYAEKPEIHTGISMLNQTVNPVISDYFAPKPENSANPVQVFTAAASWVWLTGMAVLLLSAAVSYVRLRLLVRTAVLVRRVTGRDGSGQGDEMAAGDCRKSGISIWESERVESPFVLGLIRPRIYLPTGIRKPDRVYIISHEMAHIQRKDHWIKPFGYILLSVYWFWPLLWAAYVLLCRDIEYACDERVVKRYDVKERKAYSTALLSCSVRRFRIAACPVAFGEVGVRQRVKDVLHYKKPAFWVLLAAVLSCVIVAVCFLTNPKTGGNSDADGMAQGVSGDAVDESGAAQASGTEEDNGVTGMDKTEGGNGTIGQSKAEDGDGVSGTADPGGWSIYALRPQEEDALCKAVAEAAWDWAEETGAFGGVTKSGAAAEGVTGELWATYPCVNYVILATEDSLDTATGRRNAVTVYAQVLATAFLCENTGMTELGGSYCPAAITFFINEDGSYTLSEYWTPRSGSYYEPDIREKFPGETADAALDGQRYAFALTQECYAKAVAETGVVDTWSVVEGLFERLLKDWDGLLEEGADADARIAAYPLTVRELYFYGEYTLRYIYAQFMKGGESGLNGGLLVRVMNQIISEEIQLRMPLGDGQAYFDALCESVRKTYEDLAGSQGGAEEAKQYMRERMPAQYLLLDMLEWRVFDAEAAEYASKEDQTTGRSDRSYGDYEYYLTEEELLADIEQGYLFRLETAFCKPETTDASGGNVYKAPYVRQGIWPFYVHENNIVNLEIAFSDLLMKPNKNIFQGGEQVSVEMISPDGQSVYRFEKAGEEITEDTSVKEQISVTPGEWTFKISFAYVCGDEPACLKIAAAYEAPSEEDLNWLKTERMTNRAGRL